MKINPRLPALLTIALLFSLPFGSCAQDEPPTNAPAVDTQTNEAPTLADMMASNNVVTNTVGIVLVKVSPGFWAGKYEVTQQAYRKVAAINPSAFPGSQKPVDSVSWNDVMAFCQKLTKMEQTAGELPKDYQYTLPTEAQWEMLVGNASLNDAVMKLNGARSSTAPVGSLGPNNLGLYDLRGNVMEWCLDSHDSRYRLLRGGAWNTAYEPNSRVDFRWYAKTLDDKQNDFGFRVVLVSGASP
jgi:formylglycine-generating enzyme required for sulfatase activity